MHDSDGLIVKICGLSDAASAQVAIDAGADALGFILAPSRRQIAPEDVKSIRAELVMPAEKPPMTVGVVVNVRADDISEMAAIGGFDAVQLSGDEDPSILSDLDLPVIKALRFEPDTLLDDAFAVIDPWYTAPRPVMRVMLDGHKAGSYGGSGTGVDRDFAAAIAARYPIILAGGLTPEAVTEAIEVVQPAGVDVSSGVERHGVKDPDLIRSFVERARSAVR